MRQWLCVMAFISLVGLRMASATPVMVTERPAGGLNDQSKERTAEDPEESADGSDEQQGNPSIEAPAHMTTVVPVGSTGKSVILRLMCRDGQLLQGDTNMGRQCWPVPSHERSTVGVNGQSANPIARLPTVAASPTTVPMYDIPGREFSDRGRRCIAGMLFIHYTFTGLRCGPCRYGKLNLHAPEFKVFISVRCCRDIVDKTKKVPHCYVPKRRKVKCSCQCRGGRLRPVTFQDYSPKFMYNGATYLKKCTGDYSHLQHDVVK
eukprot:scpid93147/ scgid21293/ 